MRSLLVVLLACTTGCSGLPREPRNAFTLERPWGVASARTEAEALLLAEAVDEVRPALEETWGFADRPLRIHFAYRPPVAHVSGITIQADDGDAWVAVMSGDENFAHTVAHELVHFYLAPVLDPLPYVVEEGFCGMLANRISPSPATVQSRLIGCALAFLETLTVHVEGADAKVNLRHLLRKAPPIEEVLSMGWNELLRSEPVTRNASYGLGWVIAETLGLEGLAELHARREGARLEHVPLDWILDRAGLAPLTQDGLREAFGAAIGEPPDGPLVITLTSQEVTP